MPIFISQAQHPKIEQINFFDLQPSSNYDAVVLSMVFSLLFDFMFIILSRMCEGVE